jgi:hypothetical protein
MNLGNIIGIPKANPDEVTIVITASDGHYAAVRMSRAVLKRHPRAVVARALQEGDRHIEEQRREDASGTS